MRLSGEPWGPHSWQKSPVLDTFIACEAPRTQFVFVFVRHLGALLLSLGATLVLGCYSCPWVLLLSSGAILVIGCYSCPRVLLLSSVLFLSLGAALVLGCFSCPWVLVYLLRESMTCALLKYILCVRCLLLPCPLTEKDRPRAEARTKTGPGQNKKDRPGAEKKGWAQGETTNICIYVFI